MPSSMVRKKILTIALGIAWLLLLPSCGGEPAAGATAAPSTVAATSSAATAERSPEEVVAAAVGEMLRAEAYSFEGTVTVTATSDAEFQVSGWVNGKDSEIRLTTGGQTVITRVLSGVATVEQDGVVTEIPLGEAGDAPSLEILNELRKSEFVTDVSVRGTLTAADLRASGFDVNGVAFVTVFLSDGGDISGYTMTPNNGGWSVEMSFSELTV